MNDSLRLFLNKMLLALFLTAIDPLAGSRDSNALSVQSRMELVVQHLSMADQFCDEDGEFRPVAEWPHTKLDEHGNVKEVRWYIGALPWRGGMIALEYLPDSVEFVQLNSLQIDGKFPNNALPASLKTLNLNRNGVRGSVELETLPLQLELLSVKQNCLYGRIHLGHLPPRLYFLNLSSNTFTGEVNLSNLPVVLQTLYLNQNKLTGGLRLHMLPAALGILDLSENFFSGGVRFENLPRKLRTLNLRHNHIATIVVMERMPSRAYCDARSNYGVTVEDAQGKEIRSSRISV